MIVAVERFDEIVRVLKILSSDLASRFQDGAVQNSGAGKIVNFTMSQEEFTLLLKGCARAEAHPLRFSRKGKWKEYNCLSSVMALKDYLRLYDSAVWGYSEELFDQTYDAYLQEAQKQSVIPEPYRTGLLVLALVSVVFLLVKFLSKC